MSDTVPAAPEAPGGPELLARDQNLTWVDMEMTGLTR